MPKVLFISLFVWAFFVINTNLIVLATLKFTPQVWSVNNYYISTFNTINTNSRHIVCDFSLCFSLLLGDMHRMCEMCYKLKIRLKVDILSTCLQQVLNNTNANLRRFPTPLQRYKAFGLNMLRAKKKRAISINNRKFPNSISNRVKQILNIVDVWQFVCIVNIRLSFSQCSVFSLSLFLSDALCAHKQWGNK